MKLTPVTSLVDLANKARSDENYKKLAIESAKNLGCGEVHTVDQALRWIELNAMEVADQLEEIGEDAETSILEEINSLIPLLT